jgi:monofunctional biosynthetic peptidoglycan transglycosylase
LLFLGSAPGLAVLWLFAIWPPPFWYRWNFPRETSFMAMRRHQDPVAALHRKYQPVSLARIAPALKRTVLIGEDSRFYEHHGIDYVEMRHAMGYSRDAFAWTSSRDRSDIWRAITGTLGHAGRVRGASTITQQLAKNLYLSPSRNPLRKLKEAVTAWRLELWLPKDRILELYLDTAELGNEVWGAEAASQTYFQTPARSLSTDQAATLAATLPFPRISNPYYRPGRMLWRKGLIVDRMQGKAVVVPTDSGAVAADSAR